MRLIIGEYEQGKLKSGFHETGDDIPALLLQELKGRFKEEYREANIRLTEEQLLAAATPDQDAIQAVHALGQLDITLNSLGKYTTEWQQLHHPQDTSNWDELAKRELTENGLSQLNNSVKQLIETREKIILHIDESMKKVLPSVTEITGGVLAAKLLDHAGSISRLASFPSGTVQLLGAERAFFRYLKIKDGRPPKYGVLFNHPLVQGVHPANRGKMARKLAAAISIAARVDANKGEPIGEKLKNKVEAEYRALTRS